MSWEEGGRDPAALWGSYGMREEGWGSHNLMGSYGLGGTKRVGVLQSFRGYGMGGGGGWGVSQPLGGLWDGRRRKVGVSQPPSHPAGGDAASQQEFTSCLKETLSGLARNATDLQVGTGVPSPGVTRVTKPWCQ